MTPTTGPRTDPVLLAEVALIIVLFGLGIVLYWRPAAAGLANESSWWQWMLLGVVFFAVVALEMLRRRRKVQRPI
jgi:uncharacterized membrane protein